jgi:hypothetical protein
MIHGAVCGGEAAAILAGTRGGVRVRIGVRVVACTTASGEPDVRCAGALLRWRSRVLKELSA